MGFLSERGIPYRNNVWDLIRHNGSAWELDIVLTNGLAIELNGDYYHSDKMIYDNRKMTAAEYHTAKREAAKKAGYSLIYVWEYDWYNHNAEVRAAIVAFFETGIMAPILNKLVGPENSKNPIGGRAKFYCKQCREDFCAEHFRAPISDSAHLDLFQTVHNELNSKLGFALDPTDIERLSYVVTNIKIGDYNYTEDLNTALSLLGFTTSLRDDFAESVIQWTEGLTLETPKRKDVSKKAKIKIEDDRGLSYEGATAKECIVGYMGVALKSGKDSKLGLDKYIELEKNARLVKKVPKGKEGQYSHVGEGYWINNKLNRRDRLSTIQKLGHYTGTTIDIYEWVEGLNTGDTPLKNYTDKDMKALLENVE